MGSEEEVRETFESAQPGIVWQAEPGLESIVGAFADAESSPFLDRMRAMAQDRAGGGQKKGLYEASGLTIEFYGFEQDSVSYVHADVRGSGNPMPIIRQLCQSANWKVIDDGTSQEIDLTDDVAQGWQEFCGWRDSK